MFFKPAIKALLFLSLSGAAHTSVIPGQGNQLELAQQLQMAEQLRQLEQAVIANQHQILKGTEQGGLANQEDFDTEDKSKSLPISYGKCYHIAASSKNNGYNHGDYLSRNNWNSFQLAGRENADVFQVCRLTGSCTPNQPNKVVQEGDEFSLYHFKGYSKNYVVTAGPNGIFAPYTPLLLPDNMVKFWGRKECFGEDDCPVRLRAKDQMLNYDGITLQPYNNNILFHSTNHESLVLYFEETRCPS